MIANRYILWDDRNSNYHFLGESCMNIWYLLLGIGFGIVLQRSHICFVNATSDPQITGSTEVFRAILIGILTSSLGITIIKYLSNGTLDMLGVSTISLPLIAGAFIFGIGMILAGSCASGMFIRLAEGYIIHLITIPCVILGYLFANRHRPEPAESWNVFRCVPFCHLCQKSKDPENPFQKTNYKNYSRRIPYGIRCLHRRRL